MQKGIDKAILMWYNKYKRLLYAYVRAHKCAIAYPQIFDLLHAVMDNYTIIPSRLWCNIAVISRRVGIGRRDRLKICCQQWRVGSSPTAGTMKH